MSGMIKPFSLPVLFTNIPDCPVIIPQSYFLRARRLTCHCSQLYHLDLKYDHEGGRSS